MVEFGLGVLVGAFIFDQLWRYVHRLERRLALATAVTPERNPKVTNHTNLIEKLKYLAGNKSAFPDTFAALEAAQTISTLAAEVEGLRAANRLMGDVIDYACGAPSADEAMDFIDAYREDRHTEDERFNLYRRVQARATLTKGEGDKLP